MKSDVSQRYFILQSILTIASITAYADNETLCIQWSVLCLMIYRISWLKYLSYHTWIIVWL